MAVNPPDLFPANPEKSMYASDFSIYSQLTLEEMVTLKKKEIRAKLGRKLKFREWLGLKILKTKIKKAKRKAVKQARQKAVGEKRPVDPVSMISFGSSLLGIGLMIKFFASTFSAGWPSLTFLWWLFLLAGLVLGLVALFSKKRYEKRWGKGFAIAGVVLAGVIALFWLVIVIGISASGGLFG